MNENKIKLSEEQQSGFDEWLEVYEGYGRYSQWTVDSVRFSISQGGFYDGVTIDVPCYNELLQVELDIGLKEDTPFSKNQFV
jgi:hypothetical protein